MTTQSLDLNLIPKGISPRLYVSQYDKGQTWTFNIYAGNTAYTIPNGATVTIQGTKPDKTGFQYSCTASGNVVTATEQQQMTVIAGEVPAEIRITNNNEIIATLNFILVVEPAALTDETEISETDLPIIEQAIEMFPHYQEMIDEVSSDIQTLSNREQERWGTVNLFDKDIMADVQIIELSYKTLYMKPNTTYTVSTDLPRNSENFANIFVYNSSGVPDTNGNGVWNGQTRTFTTRSDGIINVAYRTKEFTNTSTKWFLNHNFQIEEGNVATAFQPYAAPNVTLTQDTKGLTDNQFENGCVNLLKNTMASAVTNGVTYVVNDDRTINANGTCNAGTDNLLAQFTIKKGAYKITGLPSNFNGGSETAMVRVKLTNNAVLPWNDKGANSDSNRFYTFTEDTVIKVYLSVYNGTVLSNIVFKPMITVADMPNSDYEHYVPYCKSNKELTDELATNEYVDTNISWANDASTNFTLTNATKHFRVNKFLHHCIVDVDGVVLKNGWSASNAYPLLATGNNLYNPPYSKRALVPYFQSGSTWYKMYASKANSHDGVSLTALESIPSGTSLSFTLEWTY